VVNLWSQLFHYNQKFQRCFLKESGDSKVAHYQDNAMACIKDIRNRFKMHIYEITINLPIETLLKFDVLL
jgi:hypothetical protein